MKTIKLISAYPALLKTIASSLEVDVNQTVQFEEEPFVDVYPISKKISFHIDFQNNEKSPYFIRHETENSIFYFLPDGLFVKSYDVHSFSSNTSPQIECNENALIFNAPPFKKIVSFNEKYQNASYHKSYDIIYALLSGEDKCMLVALNTKTGKMKSFKGKEIEVKDNAFTVKQNFKDIAGHIITTQYKIDKEGLKRIGHEITFEKDRARIVSSDKTIPYAFLEAVKVEDYPLAYSYLSEQLQNSLPQEALQSYFGKISCFFHVEDDKFLLKNGDNKDLIALFSVSNGEIVDIDLQET